MAMNAFTYNQTKASLDKLLYDSAERIGRALADALHELESQVPSALSSLQKKTPAGVCTTLLSRLGPLAGQGVFLLDRDGTIFENAMPPGLNQTARMAKRTEFSDRPYFRIANTFREAFVADSAKSVFNEHSTIFLCAPVLDGHDFSGLLFAAAQIGAWRLPIKEAEAHWKDGRSMLLVDSTGVVLLPPNNEIQPEGSAGVPGLSELPELNFGYKYDQLLGLSRRDAVVRHIAENAAPLTPDDAILELAPDLKYYSVVTEMPKTGWKLAISIPTTGKA